jgi:hypothetical protein
MNGTNKMQLYRLIYYPYSTLHVSGDVFAHYQEHLTVLTVFSTVYTQRNPHSSVSTHPRHQPIATWEYTTKYCKYSQVLLMMGENIARNM